MKLLHFGIKMHTEIFIQIEMLVLLNSLDIATALFGCMYINYACSCQLTKFYVAASCSFQ